MLKNNKSAIDLDIKDKKIIYHLSSNSRMSYTQVSKKVGLSKNSIKYRIERMQKEGIISNFSSMVNLGALGMNTFTMLLKFREDVYKNKNIISYFKEHKFADWVTLLSGDWDMFAEFVFRDLNELYDIIEMILKEFGEILSEYKVFVSNEIIRVEHLPDEFYESLKFPKLDRKNRKVIGQKIDKIDARILNLLAWASSLTSLEISDRLNLTLDVVRYRIKGLIKNGILLKFFPEIDLAKLGYTQYLFNLKLKNLNREKIELLKKKIEYNGNVSYAFFDTLSSSLVFVCAFKNADGIDVLSRLFRTEFSDIIDKQDYFIIRGQVLFNLFPKGLINL